jgi:hypothetical protein
MRRKFIKQLTIKQILDCVQIDFEVRDLDVELYVLLHGVDVVENVVDNARNNTCNKNRNLLKLS